MPMNFLDGTGIEDAVTNIIFSQTYSQYFLYIRSAERWFVRLPKNRSGAIAWKSKTKYRIEYMLFWKNDISSSIVILELTYKHL